MFEEHWILTYDISYILHSKINSLEMFQLKSRYSSLWLDNLNLDSFVPLNH